MLPRVACPPLPPLTALISAVLLLYAAVGAFTAMVVDADCPTKVAVTSTVPALAPTTSTKQLPRERVHWFTERKALLLSALKPTCPGRRLGDTLAVHGRDSLTFTEDEEHERETAIWETEVTETLLVAEPP